MAYEDALQDTVTIYTTTTGFKGGDTVGEDVKTETPLYSNVPCRLMNVGTTPSVLNQPQKQEGFKYKWLIQMGPTFNGAERGATAVVNGDNYIITKKQEIRGDSSAIHHVVYYLEEKE
jgi:hypothetical protein